MKFFESFFISIQTLLLVLNNYAAFGGVLVFAFIHYVVYVINFHKANLGNIPLVVPVANTCLTGFVRNLSRNRRIKNRENYRRFEAVVGYLW